MFKNRLKNYGLWLSIAALIPLVMSAFGLKLHDEQKYMELINAILTVLVALGLINNPSTENRWFNDDPKNQIEASQSEEEVKEEIV